jgi:hypothetical protein
VGSRATLGRHWSARYYLCSDDRLTWRIPNQLHADLIAGKIAFPEFAATKQRVLEVFFRRSPGGPVVLEARGTFYTFSADGTFDPYPAAETVDAALQSSRSRRVQEHVFDITSMVRARRWLSDQSWQPSLGLLRAVGADLRASPASRVSRVPLLKRPQS